MISAVIQKQEFPSYMEKKYRKNITIEDYEQEPRCGELIAGGAGCGKTIKLIEDIKKSGSPIIFSSTNKAVENVSKTRIYSSTSILWCQMNG